MSLGTFRSILKFVTGGEPTPEERRELFKEAALMALARATIADTHIEAREVAAVQAVLERITGDRVEIADIQLAARSELFERQPLSKYLSDVGRKLEPTDRTAIVHGLADVIRSDKHVSFFETAYFDNVATALGATPSEIIGLIAEPPGSRLAASRAAESAQPESSAR